MTIFSAGLESFDQTAALSCAKLSCYIHIYQRNNSPEWPLGNVELEAKIYDYLFLCQVNNGDDKAANDLLGENYNAFIDFYYNPNADTYKTAVWALRSYREGAYSNPVKYPMAELGEVLFVNYSDMLKHIRGLRKVEKNH